MATIWKKGVPDSNIMIPPAYGSCNVEAISVSNNVIDTTISTPKPAGSGPLHDYRTKIVKNRLVYDFTNGSNYLSVNALYSTKTDVYVAGYPQINSYYAKATIWKNGVATTLSDGTEETSINAICLVNKDCYVGGTTAIYDNSKPYPLKTRYKATIWKNGIPTYLVRENTSDRVEVLDLKSVGDDVFALVRVKENMSIWKNGAFYQNIASIGGYSFKNPMYVTTN